MPHAWLDPDEIARLDTPLVVVDLDRVDANIELMAALMRDRGVALRPHAKTHKSVAVARRQIAAGAVGLTVATIGEGEVFVNGGIDDLFIAYPVMALGPKVERLRALAERCRLSVGVDSIEGISRLASAFRGADAAPAVRIEIDSGGRRSGVLPEEAGDFAVRAHDAGLRVSGVFTHAGQAYGGPERRSAAADEEVDGPAVAAESLRALGIEPTVISAGSTPTAPLSARPPVTEVRPGTYVFGDRQQLVLGGDPDDEAGTIALVVAATVVSLGARGGFLVDAGPRSSARTRRPPCPGTGRFSGIPMP